MRLRAASVFVAAIGLWALGGCSSDPRSGYAFGTGHDESIRTVALPMFGNTTYSHGVELDLTDAIVKEIHRSTPWRVAPADRADTTLSGTIVDVELRKLGTAPVSGLVQELAVEVAVDYEFKDNRTGRVLVARQGFRAAESFVPARGVGERIEVGERQAIEELARDIVASLRDAW